MCPLIAESRTDNKLMRLNYSLREKPTEKKNMTNLPAKRMRQLKISLSALQHLLFFELTMSGSLIAIADGW